VGSGNDQHILRVGAAAALVASSFSACRPAEPAQQPAPAVIVAESPDDPPPMEEPPTLAQDPAPSSCRVEVRLASIDKTSACWVDLPKEGTLGVLETRCADGPATLVFDKYRYEGSVTRGRFEVQHVTHFPFEDGCEWESSQSVTGSADGELVITYSEHPVEDGECAEPCSATARVEVAR
jgi:hypothetical protein